MWFRIRKVKLKEFNNFFSLRCDYKSLNLNHSYFSFLQIMGNVSLVNWFWAVKKHQSVTGCSADMFIYMRVVEGIVYKVKSWVPIKKMEHSSFAWLMIKKMVIVTMMIFPNPPLVLQNCFGGVSFHSLYLLPLWVLEPAKFKESSTAWFQESWSVWVALWIWLGTVATGKP